MRSEALGSVMSGAPRRVWVAIAAGLMAMMLFMPGTTHAQETETLPDSVEQAVRADAASRGNVDESEVETLRVEAVTWENGCMGIEPPDGACTLIIVDGFVVWVSAGDEVLRYHTDTQADVRFAEDGLDEGSVDTYPLPGGASERETDGQPDPARLIDGEIAPQGISLFSLNAPSMPAEIEAALQQQGCDPGVLAMTVEGSFIVHVFGAPEFVNAQFPEQLEQGALLIVACTPGATTPPPDDGEPTDPPQGDFSTDAVDETGRAGNGALVGVEAGDHEGYERLVFEFADELSGPLEVADGVPSYSVSYVDSAQECGSGNPVDVEGQAMLQIDLPTTHSVDPETGEELSSAPSDAQMATLGSILQVERSCAFEGQTTWIVGVDSEAGFRISELSNPTRLVVDVQTD